MNNYERLNLYPHNIETCKKVKEAFDDGEQIVSIIKATGTGKSYIGLNLSLEHKDEKIIWIVPTLAIKEHIEKTINDNSNLSIERDFPNLEIRTYSSLVDMTKEEIESIPCDLLIVDELHHLGAPVWGERVNYFVESHPDMKVFGMSAYSVRDRGTAYERDMVNPGTEELFSNTVVDRYDVYDAIIDGILPMPFVKSILTENSKIIEDLREVQKLKRIQETPIYYEIDRVVASIVKTIHKQEPIKEIVQNSIKEDGKYIYFCPVFSLNGTNDIDTIMSDMVKYLSERFPGKRIVFYKTTSDMGKVGEYNRECFYSDLDLDGNDVSDTIRIMFAKNQYNEGVHAPNVDGVFLGRETGSDIVALEQIGRALSVRGETSLRMEEYNKYTLEELKHMAKSRGINFNEDVSREHLIELLIAPTIIDLADNIGFLQELETNLKTRIRERKEKGITLTSRQIKILESWSTLDVSQRDLYNALINLRNNVQTYTWDDWYELALAYYNEHGNSEIPQRFKTINGKDYDENGVALGVWCNNQRKIKDKLSEYKIKKLEEIKFRFETREVIRIPWEEWYKLAVVYYNEHGDSEIPTKFKTKNGKDYDEGGFALGSWCNNQRQCYRRGILKEDRRQKLVLIKFRFDMNEVTRFSWDYMYGLLIDYYNEHNDLNISSDFKTDDGIALGQWCMAQRQSYKNESLSKERRQKLEQIGFSFETKRDISWERNYQLAVIYYNEYKNLDISAKFKTKDGINYDEDGIALGNWLKKQREKFESLSDEKRKKLELIGFRVNIRKTIRLPWDEWYQLAMAYFNYYGHSNIGREFKTKNGIDYDEDGFTLGIWYANQKRFSDELSEERRKKLEVINFKFENKKVTNLSWDKWYQLALAYYNKNGNSNIPQKFRTKNGIDYDEDGGSLGAWCDTQRVNYKEGTLSDDKVKKLELIDFRFDTKNIDESWESKYQLAVAYYNKHGNSEIAVGFRTINGFDYDENGIMLGKWCRIQRDRYDKLSEDRIAKLELIEFRFVTKKEHENNKENLCSEYGIEYDKYKVLKKMSYQELYAKIMYLIDNGYPLIVGDKLHEIFSMSNANMILKYMISKEEMIINYYINKKGKGV